MSQSHRFGLGRVGGWGGGDTIGGGGGVGEPRTGIIYVYLKSSVPFCTFRPGPDAALVFLGASACTKSVQEQRETRQTWVCTSYQNYLYTL